MAESNHAASCTRGRHFSRHQETLKVPMSLFRDNRQRLISRLRAKNEVSAAGAFVLLQGGVDVPFNDTDVNWPFRQVRICVLLCPLVFAISMNLYARAA
ncbi:xaa-Pro dipeptidase-like isoform X2 [Nylanderia fulva]|uniref:xaa-Pro dipeptidase-like isoform X2 n=1 Tax=Nylanderia fulva TaxID=613905 RepID=UPI0010FB6ACA|nr:xaa-Pro dipeptidase-like isoform X2 [Nylanderia fulva]